MKKNEKTFLVLPNGLELTYEVLEVIIEHMMLQDPLLLISLAERAKAEIDSRAPSRLCDACKGQEAGEGTCYSCGAERRQLGLFHEDQ